MVTTRITRLREKQIHERDALNAVLDEARIGHIGVNADGCPVVIPTAIARDGSTVLVHGSTGSRWMRSVAGGLPVCLAVTLLDGVMVARSTFESSFHYRSAVIFGHFERLEGECKQRALAVLVDKFIPGRLMEVRPSSSKEINQTLVLSLPIEEWSLKVSDDWPDDGVQDVAGSAWAGVVRLSQQVGPPRPSPDLRADIPVPPSVEALTESWQ
ncbi:MAG: pyridoxamine 5'-phosphate oxidase family protein [Ferrimicrobium sp.]